MITLIKTITRVERAKKNSSRYHIYLNEEYSFSIHEDLLIKHHLFKGKQLDEAEMKSIVYEDEAHRAYLHGLQLIGRRPHAVQELVTKLVDRGYGKHTVDAAVIRLKELGYLDDLVFAKLWTEHRLIRQHKGKQWVKQELMQKGVSSKHIEEAMGQFAEEDEFDGAMQLGVKKWRQVKGDHLEKKRKTSAYLWRRGYSPAIVQKVVRELMEAERSED
ncbi:regulatory protein RecX [Paenibacillus senegalensis]|uniref:regulatory protein RecX n=1 Tax=Paenibacillus senegalensis TaxID=1465766 RepID=UPI000287B5CD|nr:RecX family transcriptional regulator [Paenibacillus senegalensis]